MVDPDRIRSKFGALEADIKDLEGRQTLDITEYRTDRDTQAIVERRFQTGIQACIDIAGHILASEGYREPSDYGDLFRVLEEEAVISTETADRMVEMAGFRNVLTHEYAEIDHDRVYHHLQNLERFRQFVREVSDSLDLARP
jgi:uncharacterized protein YutE (UPF0331/DUF86 family)